MSSSRAAIRSPSREVANMSATTPAAGLEPGPAGPQPRRVALGPTTLAPATLPAEGPATGVAGYYDAKTASILRKYGPGPRVHFHIGCFAGRPDTGVDADALRRRIRRAQEETVERAALAWDAPRELSGRLLDAGCGLGGGAVWWAQHCPAEVTAATIAGEHVPLVARFAEEAGVGGRVRPVLADACEVAGPEPFDAVVAMESSCYFPRRRWFGHLRRIVRPGGVVCIEDTFLGREECREPFDRYWRTRVGPAAEYVRCAAEAGFARGRGSGGAVSADGGSRRVSERRRRRSPRSPSASPRRPGSWCCPAPRRPGRRPCARSRR